MEQTKQAAHAPVVLVTGAARRAGRAFAEYFAAHGYRTAVHYDRSADAAQAAAVRSPNAGTIRLRCRPTCRMPRRSPR